MKRGPKPNPQSLIGQLRTFYTENPNEWLTYDDIALKLGVTRRQAVDAAKNLSRSSSGVELEFVMIVRVAQE